MASIVETKGNKKRTQREGNIVKKTRGRGRDNERTRRERNIVRETIGRDRDRYRNSTKRDRGKAIGRQSKRAKAQEAQDAQGVPGGETAPGQDGEGEAEVDEGLRHSIGNYAAPGNQYCGTVFWFHQYPFSEGSDPVFFF